MQRQSQIEFIVCSKLHFPVLLILKNEWTNFSETETKVSSEKGSPAYDRRCHVVGYQ
jgi:hypothetical protein